RSGGAGVARERLALRRRPSRQGRDAKKISRHKKTARPEGRTVLRVACVDLDLGERLIEVGDNVRRILDTDGEAHHIGARAGRRLLRFVELAMGGGARMNDQAPGVADVGEVREELDAVNQLLAGFITALDAEGENGAGAAGEIFLRELVVGIVLKSRVRDPGDL